MNDYKTTRFSVGSPLVVVALLAALPLFSDYIGGDYYIGFICRLMTITMAVMSLNFLIGYAGMAALGHASFIGVGGYLVVAMVDAGVLSAWQAGVVALAGSAVVAGLIGAISLRTQGIYFIMITLAFAQMLYYLAISLRRYGGDDGYSFPSRLNLLPGLDTGNAAALYWVVLVLLSLVFMVLSLAANSRFGRAMEGIRENEIRMRAMGYPVYWLKLCAFAGAGAIAGLSGALTSMQNGFVSPAAMHWTQSALLIVMVVIGGVGHRWGAVLGVAVWMTLEEVLKQYTEYWHAPLGLLLIAVVFGAPRGVASIWRKAT